MTGEFMYNYWSLHAMHYKYLPNFEDRSSKLDCVRLGVISQRFGDVKLSPEKLFLLTGA